MRPVFPTSNSSMTCCASSAEAPKVVRPCQVIQGQGEKNIGPKITGRIEFQRILIWPSENVILNLDPHVDSGSDHPEREFHEQELGLRWFLSKKTCHLAAFRDALQRDFFR